MDTKRGTFIVIEGSDGAGKTTQLDLLRERLEEVGHDVEIFSFPQYDQPSSHFVRRYLEGGYGSIDRVGPYTTSLFYALDRFEAAPRIYQALAEGKVVLADRFTGSNMAHQGTKILNAEQRRGFFIWLDNLEFEMLRIPRPDVSFILRVPADISEQLLQESGKKKDLHESDRLHLARTVLVFDDLAQLFPKDFQRIDCVRSGEMLDVPTINTILWEKINPLLPPPSDKPKPKKPKASAASVEPTPTAQKAIEATVPASEETATAVAVEDTAPATSHAESTPQPSMLILEDASGLLVSRVERLIPNAQVQYPADPMVYQPQNLVPTAKKAYEAKIKSLISLHAKIVAGLVKRKLDKEVALAIASAVLPIGAVANIHIPAGDSGIGDLISDLLQSDMPELQSAGASLLSQAVTMSIEQLKDAKRPVKKPKTAIVKDIAEEFLSQNHIGQQDPVQLAGVWPRNENDLIADMLYIHTGLPLRTIQERISDWPMNRKLDVLDAYLEGERPGTALERVHYSWDLVTPYATFRAMQKHPTDALEIQTLTPRHGYDIPEEIEQAGLADTYEKCFDISLGLYSDLQQAGHHLEAQYATLNGHNQRWRLTTNVGQLAALSRHLPGNPTLQTMQAKLTEIHPAIAESLSQ